MSLLELPQTDGKCVHAKYYFSGLGTSIALPNVKHELERVVNKLTRIRTIGHEVYVRRG